MTDRDGTTAYLGLGSNLGSRLDHLREGLRALAAHPRLDVTGHSGVWESEFVGAGSQDPYLNAVVALRTELPPAVLLAVCKGIERAAGRLPDGHGQPRTLDLDVLLVDDLVQQDADPVLPHPRLLGRGFVLAPLSQVAPRLRLPDSGETVAGAYAKIRRKPGPWLRHRPDLELVPSGADEEAKGRGALGIHRR